MSFGQDSAKAMHYGKAPKSPKHNWYNSYAKCGTFLVNPKDHLTTDWAKVTCKRCLKSHRKDLNIAEVKITHLQETKDQTYCGWSIGHLDANERKRKVLKSREGVSCRRCKAAFKSRDVKKKTVHLLNKKSFLFGKLAYCGFQYDPRYPGHKRNSGITTDPKKVTCKRCLKALKNPSSQLDAPKVKLSKDTTFTFKKSYGGALAVDIGEPGRVPTYSVSITSSLQKSQCKEILEELTKHLDSLVER